ncbi:MAG: isoaspartyl peptidase/L-asparaginase family protein [Gammaproteobacteria bacterium]
MTFAIIVHGGAGAVAPQSLDARKQGCRAAVEAGQGILKKGGNALDAVEAAAMVLENNPLFNAGKGSTLNCEGRVETDAAIMDGATLQAGAVTAVSGIRNPIRLARKVMEASPHILLAGAGAARFAREQGIELCDPAELVVPAQQQHWQREHGTVGAVALDAHGHLAAATSTGGIFNKLPGRVGDTPLIGCGTYADGCAAVSCTGKGEDIIRVTLARHAAWLLEQGVEAGAAAEQAMRHFAERTHSEAGIILVDRGGHVGYAHNTPNMPICGLTPEGRLLWAA